MTEHEKLKVWYVDGGPYWDVVNDNTAFACCWWNIFGCDICSGLKKPDEDFDDEAAKAHLFDCHEFIEADVCKCKLRLFDNIRTEELAKIKPCNEKEK
jgi:hypothetical protein